MVKTKKFKNVKLSSFFTVEIKLFPIIYKPFALDIFLEKL